MSSSPERVMPLVTMVQLASALSRLDLPDPDSPMSCTDTHTSRYLIIEWICLDNFLSVSWRISYNGTHPSRSVQCMPNATGVYLVF